MDKKFQEQYSQIARQFAENAAVLQAIGDETRQHILLCMMELPCRAEGGTRVGPITEKTHLSRPSVSHHIKILKDAGILGVRSEGKKNYYYMTNENSKFTALLELFENVMDLSRKINEEKNPDPKRETPGRD